ncbi:MAG: hypothetical protein Q8S15_11065 [Erysipelotrichaceae bacterium]|nr:hypothetical protein [Erysipelotrichaceae bacterium]
MNKKTVNTPLVFVVIYILMTILLSFIGPVKYYNYSYGYMLFFMTLVIIAIVTGYLSTSKSYILNQKRFLFKSSRFFAKESTIDLIVQFSIIIALAFEVMIFVSYSKSISSFSLQTIFYNIINIGKIYQISLDVARESRDVSLLRQFITLFGVFKQIAIVGYLIRSDRLVKFKIFFWITLILSMVNVLAFKGTQKEIGDLAIYFLSVWMIKHAMRGNIKLSKILVPILILVFGVFGFMQLSRASTYNINIKEFHNSFFMFNSNHIVYKLFGSKMGFAITSVIFYVSGGYYGLTKSLLVPFRWTYGLGNSFALSSYAAQYFGFENMIVNSIPSRAEAITGYPALMYWSTMFPWIASDLTFPGSIVFMFAIARIYSICWKESVHRNNLLSALLFSRLNIMWAFLPANNQLMQTRESTLATLFLLIIWFFFHNRFSSMTVKVGRKK